MRVCDPVQLSHWLGDGAEALQTFFLPGPTLIFLSRLSLRKFKELPKEETTAIT
jgi:hypothetical protein